MIRFEVRGVLAGAYMGKGKRLEVTRRHAVLVLIEAAADVGAVRIVERVLCGDVEPDNLGDVDEQPHGHDVDCPKCLRKLPA